MIPHWPPTDPSTPLTGYEIVELTIAPGSRRVDEIAWPPNCLVVAVTEQHEFVTLGDDTILSAGERVIVLAPMPSPPTHRRDRTSVVLG